MTDPDMGYWTYAYDALNLISQTDARGCTTNLTYDVLNRLTGKTYSNCPTTDSVSYGYDSTTDGNKGYGRRTSMTDGSGSTSWKYDSRGQVIKETKTITGAGTFMTEFTYNSAGLLKDFYYPANNTGNSTYPSATSYGYYAQMSLNTVGSYVIGTAYDAAGRIESMTLGTSPNLIIDYNYQPWTTQGGRMNWVKVGPSTDPTHLQYLEYNYDAVGNINWIKDWKAGNPQQQSFNYDGLNRLTSAVVSGGSGTYSQTYTYNAVTGNLQSMDGGVTYYQYNDSSHKHAVTQVGSNTYGYDANGNMTTRNVGGVAYTLTYDAENRLVKVNYGYYEAKYTYDGDGNRVRSMLLDCNPALVDCAIVSDTAYIGNHTEWNVLTNKMKRYYYAGAQRVAMSVIPQGQAETVSYILGDHLGSTSLTVNTGGIMTGELRYKAFAPCAALQGCCASETRYTWGTAPTQRRYTGQINDAEIGLYFYNSRFYDPTLGRFIQPDSIIPESQGTQAWDRFAYVNNSPINYTDPDGHNICTEDLYCYDTGKKTWTGKDWTAKQALYHSTPKDTSEVLAKNWEEVSLVLRIFSDTVDIVSTIIDCARGNCSFPEVVFAFVPLIPAGIVKHVDKIVEIAPKTEKLVPNPFGRKGGLEHQSKVSELQAQITARGNEAITEYSIKTPGGIKSSRAIDVVEVDKNKNVIAGFQIGLINKSGSMVSREVRAINDIKTYGIFAGPINFIAYNSP